MAVGCHPGSMPSPPDRRASDAERERTVAQLREHALAGRLTADELDARSADAYGAARVRGARAVAATRPTGAL
jgi:hypothetical protein